MVELAAVIGLLQQVPEEFLKSAGGSDEAGLSDAEIESLVRDAIASTGAASVKDMGKVMGAVKAKAAGRADMGAVSARIKATLGG